MRQLCIRLLSSRDLEGEVRIEDERGRVRSGPFPISGRAADPIAAAHGNPERNPLLPYGDPPTGVYRIGGLRETGAASGLRTDLYGRAGAIVLLPWSGDAALADAVGRFEIFIHGGAPGKAGALRMSVGHFRVSNEAMAALSVELRGPDRPEWAVCLEEDQDAVALGERSPGGRWSVPQAPMRPTHAPLSVSFGEYSPTDNPEIGEPRVDVDPEAEPTSIAEQAGDQLISAARDLGLETLDTFGGDPIPNEAIGWTEPAAKLAGGLAGAAELLSNGQTEAAYDAAKDSLINAIPDIAAVIAVDVAAPSLVETAVAVGISTAVAGMTLSAGAILVTSAVVTVGVAAAVAMGTEKLTKVCVELAQKHL